MKTALMVKVSTPGITRKVFIDYSGYKVLTKDGWLSKWLRREMLAVGAMEDLKDWENECLLADALVELDFEPLERYDSEDTVLEDYEPQSWGASDKSWSIEVSLVAAND